MKPMYEPRGYRAMLTFLAGRLPCDSPSSIAELLKELALGSDGLPSDPVRAEWNAAAKDAFSATASEQIVGLHLE